MKRPSPISVDNHECNHSHYDLSPCEPMDWKRTKLDSEELNNCSIEENWDSSPFEVGMGMCSAVPSLKFNRTIES